MFAASGTITAVALLSMFTALDAPDGRIAVVDPLVATAPLFTIVFSAIWLRDLERVTKGVLPVSSAPHSSRAAPRCWKHSGSEHTANATENQRVIQTRVHETPVER